jgi:tripartite-type tricarboxylate transporter receptor subunit TctC
MIGRGRLLVVACLFAGIAQSHAQAPNFPTRQLEMIIPFSAGSGVDLIARGVAAAMSEQLKQIVIPINRDGATGTIAFNALAAAAPDGYTIGAGPTTPITNAPYLVKGIRYTPESFDYVCHVFDNIFSIAVGPNSPYKTAQELFDAAAKNPGKLNYAHSGVGTIPYLSIENLADTLKVKFQHVAFRSESQWLPLLLEGGLDFASTGLSSMRGQNVRLLLVFADERHPLWPDVPTAKELGITESVPPGYNGVYAPGGLPAPILATLERACAEGLKSTSVARATERTGMAIHYLNSAQFRARALADYKWKGALIRRLGLAPP